MKTKAKKFSHKLLALFMAIVMGVTCFSGVMTSYAAEIEKSATMGYHDEDLVFNQLAWRIVSDEQTATAILDYLDDYLLPVVLAPMVENLVGGLNLDYGVAKIWWEPNNRQIFIDAGLIGFSNYPIDLHLRSVNELLHTIEGLNKVIHDKLEGYLPTLQYAYLTATAGMTREKNTSCEILSGVLGILRQLSFNAQGKLAKNAGQNDIIGELLRGDFQLAGGALITVIGWFVTLDLNIYNMLQPLFKTDAGYESNFTYNVVKSMILNNFLIPSGEFSGDEIAAMKNDTVDNLLISALNRLLLQKINVLVTYDQAYGTGDFDENNDEIMTIDNSARRKLEITEKMNAGMTYEEACDALGYDPNLRYSTEIKYEDDGVTVKDDFTNNILLFVYGNEKLEITPSDTFMSFAFRALKLAWKTVLSGTVDLLHVNSDVDRGHGKNFDNEFYYWTQTQPGFVWNYDNVAANYTQENLNNWAADKMEKAGASSVEEYLGWVKETLVYDRTALETSDGTWEDIDATTLFGKLRYSPLAHYGFNIETGPINLYFLQTGTSYLDAFFENDYDGYGSMVAALNDCLVAAVKDIFVDCDNVVGTFPTLRTTSSSDPATIADTLTQNALDVIEYTADAIDENILLKYKTAHPDVAQYSLLTEENVEEAMMPLIASLIGEVWLTKVPLKNLIHPDEWDAAKDVEAIAYLALEEYLSYVLPQNDYSVLITRNADNTINATLEGTILPMARDALGYILEPIVPLTDANGNVWKAEESQVTDTDTTIFTLLNSVLCYYADDYQMKDASKGLANGVAALLGLCDEEGKSTLVDNTEPLPSGYSDRLWYNIDLVIKKLAPVIGELQYGTKNAVVSSEDLIWNDIVLGVLNIGDTSVHSSGLGGVSNFIYRFLTICTAPAIADTKILNTVYDFLRDLVNGLFGVRYSTQKFGEVVPASTSATPFDALLQKNVIAGTAAEPGVAQKIIIRLVEASGFGGYGTNQTHFFADSLFRGVAFAMNALVSFKPDIFPTLADSGIYNADSEMTPSAQTGLATKEMAPSTVRFTNNITGLNTAHLEGNKVVTDPRYSAKITEVRYYDVETYDPSDAGSYNTIDEWVGLLVEPGKTVEASLDGMYYNGEGEQIWITEIYYDAVTVDGQPLTAAAGLDATRYQNLVTTSVEYMSDDISWQDEVYPDGKTMPTGGDIVQWDQEGYTHTTTNGNVIKSTSKLNSNFIFHYPQEFLVAKSDPMAARNFSLYIENQNKDEKGMDGIYSFDTATINGTAVNDKNAKVISNGNGDALHIGLYDYSTDGGATWNRNPKSVEIGASGFMGSAANYTYSEGYTAAEIADIRNTVSDKSQFVTRTHVQFTQQELKDNEMYATHTEDYVYIKSSTKGGLKHGAFNGSTAYPHQYDNVLGRISTAGPAPGTYIEAGKISIGGEADANRTILGISDTSELVAGTYPFNLTGYAGGNTAPFTINFVIVDDSEKPNMEKAYNDFMDLVSQYSDRDFTDYDASTQTSAVFAQAKKDAAAALKSLSTPLKTTNIDTINQVYIDGQAALKTNREALEAGIDQSTSQMFIEKVSAYREPYNQNNFNIISYNMMTKAARKIESNYKVVFNYTATDPETGVVTTTDSKTGKLLEQSVSYKDYKGWRDNDEDNYDIVADSVHVTSKLSNVQIVEYTNKFYEAMGRLYERGYLGRPLEKEIVCATGGTYNDFTVTPAVYDEDGNMTAEAVVQSTAIAAPEFGAYVDGKLVNEGEVKYPAQLWTNYVNAIADAVSVAQLGNGDYAHKAQALYDLNADDYNAQVTDCYDNDSDLQIAEIALEKTYLVDTAQAEGGNVVLTYGDVVENEDGTVTDNTEQWASPSKVAIPWKDYVTVTPVAEDGYEFKSLLVNGTEVPAEDLVEADGVASYSMKVTADTDVAAVFEKGETTGFTVSGAMTIAADATGADSGFNLKAVLDISANGVVIGHTNEDGTFSVTVPSGTTEITISGGSAIARTITLSGATVDAGNVPIAIGDYSGDALVDGNDLSTFLSYYGAEYNVFADFTADGLVDGNDLSGFLAFYNATVDYDAIIK